ncbi:MAG: thioredoxin family protein [Crocinitomicaceae bacterium]|nr:thioredoxin family protein [Crocinitomicaceae bacterium]NDA97867.1 thioredoxin family protein [Flavobacteriia bacterium]NDC28042.1 thioredoxin family protein [Crocinitomicaceae bacterium]NDC92739.1 thioredoxin family protein [Flavobacteriales bacterium]
MKTTLAISVCIIFMFVFGSFNLTLEKRVDNFTLRNVNGKNVSTQDYKDAKGFIVIFTCNHCPFAKLYTNRFNELNTKYSNFNVPLIAINSMDTLLFEEETFELMQQKAKKEKYNFPYLQDVKQDVGKEFDAQHTPMAFVIWKENNEWIIKYKGAVDDNGAHPKLANSFISKAVDELLNGKPVSNSETQSFGCAIFYRK